MVENNIFQLGIGVIALYALILVLRGRNQDEQSQNNIVSQLVVLVGSFMKQTEKSTIVLELLAQKAQLSLDALTLQSSAIGANTNALNAISKNLKDDFMPTLTTLLTTNHQQTLDEFRPIAEKLSAIGMGVDALNKALLAHRESESKIMSAVHEQQGLLHSELVKAEQTLEKIFNKVIQESVEADTIAETLNEKEASPVVEKVESAA